MSKIHVTRTGRGYPLVLIHGWGFDSRVWLPLLPMLNQYYEVYCIDLPGFGSSSHMNWGEFKQSLLSQLPAQFALAGWSLGGMVGTRLLLEEPHRVSHFMSIASSPRFVEEEHWPGIPAVNLSLFYDRLTTSPNEVLQEFMALQLPGGERNSTHSPTIDGLKMGLDWLLTWDFRDELSNIQIPVLYVFGRLDSIVPRKIMPVMQSMFPKFQYVMLNKAAHALFLSHSEMFLEILKEFI